jgi:hypothetical protein
VLDYSDPASGSTTAGITTARFFKKAAVAAAAAAAAAGQLSFLQLLQHIRQPRPVK